MACYENGEAGFDNLKDPVLGMRGTILDDSAYVKYHADDYVFKTYDINALQAKDAWSVIKSERSSAALGSSRYQLLTDQCTTFGCAVIEGAGLKPPSAGLPKRPTVLYESILKDAQ